MNRNIFLYCEKSCFPFFEDYILTFLDRFRSKLVLIDDLNVVEYNETDIYLFMAKIPQRIFSNQKIKAIYVNMEQLTRTNYLNYLDTITNYNIPSIDYSQGNCTLRKNLILLRYQYLPEEIEHLSGLSSAEKIYDLAFVGTASPRRYNILQQLRQQGVRIIEVRGWRDDRDCEILKAKILLNIHYAENYTIYESIRCDRFLFNNMMVITESSVSQESMDVNELLIVENYDNLIHKVIDVLQKYSKYYEEFLEKKERLLPGIIESRKQDIVEVQKLLDNC